MVTVAEFIFGSKRVGNWSLLLQKKMFHYPQIQETTAQPKLSAHVPE